MAHKDYVARGRAAKAQPAPTPTAPLPWLRIFLTVGLIGLFAVGLWSIKGKAPQQPVSDNVVKPQVTADPLPDMPEEKWEFIKTLPDQTVEVEVEEQAASDKQYLMQCGSFRQQDQAEQMRAKAAFQGLEAQIRPTDGKNGRWYRVIFGPYQSKRVAEKDKHSLRRANISSCKIWYWDL